MFDKAVQILNIVSTLDQSANRNLVEVLFMFFRLSDSFFIKAQYKCSVVMGCILLSFTAFQKVEAAPTTGPVGEHLSSSQAATAFSTTEGASSTITSTKNPDISEQHGFEPVSEEQECWNLIPSLYKPNGGSWRECYATSANTANFLLPCAAREELNCKLINAAQVNDLGFEINNLPENTILVVKYPYQVSLPTDKRIYNDPQLAPFPYLLAQIYKMNKANLERMAWRPQQLTDETLFSKKSVRRCIPFKTPSRLKKNSVLIGVVTDNNGNKIEGSRIDSVEEMLVPVCNEMGPEYHRDSMISVGSEKEDTGLSSEEPENYEKSLNIQNIGIVHISGFSFLPRMQQLSMPLEAYSGVDKPYVKINCFNGEVRVQSNAFLLTDSTSVSMECVRKDEEVYGIHIEKKENIYKQYVRDRANSHFMFIDNNVFGMRGYSNVGLRIVSDSFYVRELYENQKKDPELLMNSNYEYEYEEALTLINLNNFYGEMEYAIKIVGFDPFFSAKHYIKYNCIAGDDEGDMKNGLFLAGSPLNLYEKSSYKYLSIFKTVGNDVATTGSAFVVEGMQSFSMSESRVTTRHLITHSCTLYADGYCELYHGKPPIFVDGGNPKKFLENRVYVEDEDFLASHMYSGNIHFIQMDTGASCDFPQPCLRDEVSSTTQAPSALIFSPHKPQEVSVAVIRISQNLKEKDVEYFSLDDKQ